MGKFFRSLWRIPYAAHQPTPGLKFRSNESKKVLQLLENGDSQAPALNTSAPQRLQSLRGQERLLGTCSASCGGALFPIQGGQLAELDVAARQVAHRLFHSQAELHFQASLPSTTDARSRPRRPMKPLSESHTPLSRFLKDPTEAPTTSSAPSQTPYGVRTSPKPSAQTNQTPREKINSTNSEPSQSQRSSPSNRDSQQQAPRKFGVISPQEVSKSSTWLGSRNEKKAENNGRKNDEARGQRLDVRRGVDSAELADRMVIKNIKDSSQQPTLRMPMESSGKRVSFGTILKSRRATPPILKRTPAPVLEEDFQGLENSPPQRNEAVKKIPSWKVGLANKEQRQAKAASKDAEPKINEAIRAKTVRLVDPEGQSHEVVSLGEALRRAREAGLDVVEVNAVADPPVCKLVDHKKFKFEAKKKEKTRKKQELEQRRERIIKEVRLSSRTDYRDMEMKARAAKEHLSLGYQVRCFVQFKKGDRRADIGLQLLPEMLELLKEHGTVNKPPRENSGRLEMFLRPLSLAERKKLPEYKSQAGDEAGTEKKKKEERSVRQTHAESMSTAEEREEKVSEEDRFAEDFDTNEESEEFEDEEEDEEFDDGTESKSIAAKEEGANFEVFLAEDLEDENEMEDELYVSDDEVAASEDDSIEKAIYLDLEELEEKREADEAARLKLDKSKKKRWATQMRRPMQVKSTAKKKRRQDLEDEDDEDEGERKVRDEMLDEIADEGSSSGSESDDENGRRGRKQRTRERW